MDAKTEAEHRRNIANLLDEIAEHRDAIGVSAEGARVMARENRRRADELDPPAPPQPEWQNGDLVRDRFGNLWRRDASTWRSFGANISCSTAALEESRSQLTRVLTYDPAKQRIADPARQEVVVSLDGLDQRVLDAYHEAEGDQPMSTAGRIARRAARAAREQLGEVQ